MNKDQEFICIVCKKKKLKRSTKNNRSNARERLGSNRVTCSKACAKEKRQNPWKYRKV